MLHSLMKVCNIEWIIKNYSFNYIILSLLILGETDWKIIVIDVNDPLSEQMNGKDYFW